MRVRIKRQDMPGSEPYWQTFIYEKTEQETVAGILACRDICPMKIPTLSSIGYMNRW